MRGGKERQQQEEELFFSFKNIFALNFYDLVETFKKIWNMK